MARSKASRQGSQMGQNGEDEDYEVDEVRRALELNLLQLMEKTKKKRDTDFGSYNKANIGKLS